MMIFKLAKGVVEFFKAKCGKFSRKENFVICLASLGIIVISSSLSTSLTAWAKINFGNTAAFAVLLTWFVCALLLLALACAAIQTAQKQAEDR